MLGDDGELVGAAWKTNEGFEEGLALLQKLCAFDAPSLVTWTRIPLTRSLNQLSVMLTHPRERLKNRSLSKRSSAWVPGGASFLLTSPLMGNGSRTRAGLDMPTSATPTGEHRSEFRLGSPTIAFPPSPRHPVWRGRT